eukprot:11789673-Prorocentrum_lima.AAC.1
MDANCRLSSLDAAARVGTHGSDAELETSPNGSLLIDFMILHSLVPISTHCPLSVAPETFVLEAG